MKNLLLIVLCLFFMVGCSGEDSNDISVDYMEAKEKIINENAIMVDVRTEEEYNQGHINGAVLLTLDEINEESATNVIGSKDNVVIVYCRSGNRSSQAVEVLNNLGYTKVYDLGAMSNWEE